MSERKGSIENPWNKDDRWIWKSGECEHKVVNASVGDFYFDYDKYFLCTEPHELMALASWVELNASSKTSATLAANAVLRELEKEGSATEISPAEIAMLDTLEEFLIFSIEILGLSSDATLSDLKDEIEKLVEGRKSADLVMDYLTRELDE